MRIKKTTNRFLVLVLSLMMMIMSAAIPGSSQAAYQLFDSNNDRQLFCRGGRDFSVWLYELADIGDFVEYWKDIFYRYNSNICQYTDIDSLLTRLSRVRQQMRAAFYACADTSAMKQAYYRLEVELRYLRKYINTDAQPMYKIDESKVKQELYNYYVNEKGWYSATEFEALYNTLKVRYEARLEGYKNCKDPNWQNLVDKWNEFRDTAGGIGPALTSAKESVSKRWDRMANTPMSRGGDFWGSLVSARLNGLPVEEGLEQILDTLKKNTPAGVTFQELQQASSASANRVNYSKLGATYMASYQAQYLETSDEYSLQIKLRLDDLKTTIENTFPFQNQTTQCVKGINQKQCP